MNLRSTFVSIILAAITPFYLVVTCFAAPAHSLTPSCQTPEDLVEVTLFLADGQSIMAITPAGAGEYLDLTAEAQTLRFRPDATPNALGTKTVSISLLTTPMPGRTHEIHLTSVPIGVPFHLPDAASAQSLAAAKHDRPFAAASGKTRWVALSNPMWVEPPTPPFSAHVIELRIRTPRDSWFTVGALEGQLAVFGDSTVKLGVIPYIVTDDKLSVHVFQTLPSDNDFRKIGVLDLDQSTPGLIEDYEVYVERISRSPESVSLDRHADFNNRKCWLLCPDGDTTVHGCLASCDFYWCCAGICC